MLTRAAFVFLAVAAVSGPQAQDEQRASPVPVDLTENVQVRILQMEVTAWPKDGDVDRCRELTAADFQVQVMGNAREVLAADRLGDLGRVMTDPEDPATADTDLPMQYVVVFDMWHLNMWSGFFPPPAPRMHTLTFSFDWVREMLEERFQPGDRVLLASFAGQSEARIFTPWLEDRAAALQALNDMEVDPTLRPARRDHSHDVSWFEAWKTLLEALGNVPGRKHLIYLGDDWRPEWTLGAQALIPSVGARAQKNHVLIQAVDVLAPWRTTRELESVDLQTPAIIGQLATVSGGHLFEGSETVSNAVKTLRRIQGCQFLLSVGALPRDLRKNGIRTHARILRQGFRLDAPERIEDPRRGATEEEKRRALFLFQEWGRGLFAQARLWPLRPTGKKDNWRAMLMVRVRNTDTEIWTADMDEVVINAIAYKRSKVLGEYREVLRGDELTAFRSAKRGRAFMFPVEVRSGEITVAVTASATGTHIGANSRTHFSVPRPPAAGEIHPWFLVDRIIRVGDEMSLAPAAYGDFPADRPPLFLGYGCAPETGDIFPGAGKLIRQVDQTHRDLPVTWFDPEGGSGQRAVGERSGCGWVVSGVKSPLAPGLWAFYPPLPGNTPEEGAPGRPALTFRISASGSAGVAP